MTKNPMKPMMAKPMAVATAIFWNSAIRITNGHAQVINPVSNIGEKTNKMATLLEALKIEVPMRITTS